MTFRSRLEARWAVFFDTLGVPFSYEPEGFDMDGLRYLPDFWLPEQRLWIEVKPVKPSAIEIKKAALLAEGTGHDVVVFFGSIPSEVPVPEEPYVRRTGRIRYDDESGYRRFADGLEDIDHIWCECPVCGYVGVTYEGRAARLPCGCLCRRDRFEDKGYNADSPRILMAFAEARNARYAGPTFRL